MSKSKPLVYQREGSPYWYCTKSRKSTGTTDKRRAEAYAAKLITEEFDRKRLGIAPQKTWDEAYLSWIEEVGSRIKSGRNQGYICQIVTPHLTGMYLPEITKEVVSKIMEGRTTREPSKQNNTANQYVAFISKIIRHGGISPPKFVRYPTLGGRTRYLTVEEWFTLSSVMPKDFRHLCEFALATGLRESNVMGLKWEWVKGDVLEIFPEFTKTKQPYSLPLNLTAQRVLEERRNEKVKSLQNAFLCDGRDWYRSLVGRHMKNALLASKVAPITFHGLRHTFASWLTQNRVPDSIVDRLGCWKLKGGTGRRYSHLAVEHLREYAEIIDGVLQPQQERRVM